MEEDDSFTNKISLGLEKNSTFLKMLEMWNWAIWKRLHE